MLSTGTASSSGPVRFSSSLPRCTVHTEGERRLGKGEEEEEEEGEREGRVEKDGM